METPAPFKERYVEVNRNEGSFRAKFPHDAAETILREGSDDAGSRCRISWVERPS